MRTHTIQVDDFELAIILESLYALVDHDTDQYLRLAGDQHQLEARQRILRLWERLPQPELENVEASTTQP